MIIRSMNHEKEFPEGKTVQECLKALDAFPRGTLAAQSGGVVRELNDILNQDCTLIPLTLENEEGRRIYERSLRFVMLLALRHLYPMQRVRIEYSVGYGVFVRLPGVELHRQDIVRIENEMRRLTDLDLVFEKKRWTKEDAIRYFAEEKQDDKVELLRRRPVPYFNMYSIDGMWEYFYGAMTVSTGYVRVFTMFELRGGFVLQLPAGADFDHAAPYIYRPKHLEVFAQSADWCEILGVTNVSDLSRMIETAPFHPRERSVARSRDQRDRPEDPRAEEARGAPGRTFVQRQDDLRRPAGNPSADVRAPLPADLHGRFLHQPGRAAPAGGRHAGFRLPGRAGREGDDGFADGPAERGRGLHAEL